ncbi:MAG TPA: phosphatase PAP2 family protein [Nocardioides sp.]|uniref:phosphatase PAP2 family protein n=1 Tax=Nocardioides sp. TaxID=35761 RepID=UPI002F403458
MHTAVSSFAQVGLYVVAALSLVVWLTMSRPEKVALAVQVVIGLVAVAVLVKLAGAIHDDPRPFVVDPSLHPWFSHPADNGFPSDHTAVGCVTAFLVLFHRRLAGLGVLALAILVGVARVIAHVHHVEDIVAGILIGLVAAACGVVCWLAVRRTTWAERAAGTRGARETASPGRTGRP